MGMGCIISVANVKGGVGKTTVVHNVSHALTLYDKKVLMIDLDLQENLSDRSIGSRENVKKTAVDVFIDQDIDIKSCIYKTAIQQLDIVPARIDIAEVSRYLGEENKSDGLLRLRNQLNKIIGEYDFIFLDLHPSLDFLFASAMIASDYYIIPVHPSIDSIKGVNLTTKFACGLKKVNPKLKELGIVISDFDTRTKVSKQVTKTLVDLLGDRLFHTKIVHNTTISQAAVNYKTVFQYKSKGICNENYSDLANEIVDRIK